MFVKLMSICIFSCAALFTGPIKPVKNTTTPKTVKSQQAWKVVSLRANCCKVAFPAAPTHSSKTHAWGNTNMKLVYDAYYAKSSKDFETMVFVIEYPQAIQKAQKDGVLRSVLQGFINHHAKNRLVSYKPVQKNQNQGIEFIVQNDNQFYLGRAFIKNNQLFFLIFQCRSLQTNQQSYQNFVESLNWN